MSRPQSWQSNRGERAVRLSWPRRPNLEIVSRSFSPNVNEEPRRERACGKAQSPLDLSGHQSGTSLGIWDIARGIPIKSAEWPSGMLKVRQTGPQWCFAT